GLFAAAVAPAHAATPANIPTPPEVRRASSADEALQLSPFEVLADSDTSYGALNSNSLTRFQISLSEMPATADVFTETFMKDVGATSVEELISNYTAGGGYTTNDPGSDSAAMQAGDRQATSSVTVRGLMSPTLRRDAFIQLGSLTNPGSTGQGFTSNFDIERVEVINGPQSLLYGSGGAGGVLNTIS
ncbi:MAG: Plug domain-containing protein, partial [Verrucomicrobiota bacterium]